MKRRKLPHNDTAALIPFLIDYWRKWSKMPGPDDRLQTREFRSVVELVRGLESGPANFEDPVTGRKELGASLLYTWQKHYQQALSLLGELPRAPRRVLDLCSGLGSFARAAFRHGAEEVLCLDKSEIALTVGSELCGYSGFAPRWDRWDGPWGPLPQGPFDLIVLGHGLEELFPARHLEGAIEKMGEFLLATAQRLTSEGHLLLVESSLNETNRWFLALRDELRRLGLTIQAPCIWQGACPAKEAQAPCFAQREMIKPPFVAEIQRSARINASSLKMSYLLLKHPSQPAPRLKRPIDEEKWYRVISPPFESHLGKRIYLCGEDGKRDLGCRLPMEDHRRETFETLQRGGLYRLGSEVARGRHAEVDLKTRFSMVAPPGRPLPEGQI